MPFSSDSLFAGSPRKLSQALGSLDVAKALLF